MIITEKQIMQLIKAAESYIQTIEVMISYGLASGDPQGAMRSINDLLCEIKAQQSDELKEME